MAAKLKPGHCYRVVLTFNETSILGTWAPRVVALWKSLSTSTSVSRQHPGKLTAASTELCPTSAGKLGVAWPKGQADKRPGGS